MKEIKIITGKENVQNIQNLEILALVKFYQAFNDRNLKLMKAVWLNTKEASMNNPLGGIMRGWSAIESVYDKIFNGKATVYVEFYDFTIHKTKDMFFATGRERGYFKTDEIEIQLAIRTSRIFKKINGEWKQIQHHGSIDNSELLKKYQKLVRK
jgi:ketosteroid isomerase-like protein